MEKRPQFLKMNACREENPPPRHLGCPDYKKCLTLAAYRNFCLDCSACDIHGTAAGTAAAETAAMQACAS
jgi:hypothetical protein